MVFLLKIGILSAQTEITQDEIYNHIKYLASDQLGGRVAGTENGGYAAGYIANEFKMMNLKMLGEGGLQSFLLETQWNYSKNSRLTIEGKDSKFGKDFWVIPTKIQDSVSGKFFFCGCGYQIDSIHWNEVDPKKIKNSIVVIYAASPDCLAKNINPYNDLENRIDNLSKYNPKAIIVITSNSEDLQSFSGIEYSKQYDYQFPVFILNDKTANRTILRNFKDTSLYVTKQLKKAKKPFEIKSSITMVVKYEKIDIYGQNVAAILEGSDPILKNEIIVIGAHYDHIEPLNIIDTKTEKAIIDICNGADDNASGTAGLMEIAEYICNMKEKPKRSILFMAFDAEEMGLIGSFYFVDHPLVDLEKIKFMINLDMIGYLRENSLELIGAGSFAESHEFIDELNKKHRFKISINNSPMGGSDHQSFYTKNIPVIFFHTGLHPYYHTGADELNIINAEGEMKVCNMAADMLLKLAEMDTVYKFTRYSGAGNDRERKKLKVTLGIMPDLSSDATEGLLVRDVKAGGLAEKSGILKNDIIVKIDGQNVENIYTYMQILEKLDKGVTIEVEIKRKDELKKFSIAL